MSLCLPFTVSESMCRTRARTRGVSASAVSPDRITCSPLASAAIRAATLTESPKTSPSTSIVGPKWKPTRIASRTRPDGRLLGDSRLHFGGCLGGLVRRREDGHHFVTDGLDHPAGVPLAGGLDQGKTAPDRRQRIGVADGLVESRTAADVGEEDGKVRSFVGHARMRSCGPGISRASGSRVPRGRPRVSEPGILRRDEAEQRRPVALELPRADAADAGQRRRGRAGAPVRSRRASCRAG